jgi:hypothetical protein
MVFTEGLLVQYENYVGQIRFVCNSYVTLCVNVFPGQKQRDVCMLIYRDNFKKIKLLKESSK